ncbi:hypothetical protein [Cognatiyoonia sp. IB215182]|uniref:hypothetical protein n=1 Tax=Cognatiyoonia sp. IB215182 TaxID=3097353 RepID=UPI002A16E587|nr:hypothetical protein [Cognatiyoonia sp. IB215182]MDX8352617.1 hypothetical protein [Cognatiyoonia sp. IB215182]
MSDATRKAGLSQTNVRLFPLSPEAVRRLRRVTEVAEDAAFPADREDDTTTHADDLLRRLLQG